MSSEEGSSLFRRARDGSPEAINALFERYGGRLHALIRARLGPNLRRRLESRDILQATLLKGFQGIDRFEGSGSRSFMAWLGTVAQAEIRDQADFHRRQKRDYARETGLHSKADRVAETIRSEVSRLQLQEDAERMERGLDALSESHREVILLRSFEELTFREIGERLDKSPDACRMLYARALTALTLEMRAI
jgi:RNA polymerase sigma-70 factor (ECF subfamily)